MAKKEKTKETEEKTEETVEETTPDPPKTKSESEKALDRLVAQLTPKKEEPKVEEPKPEVPKAMSMVEKKFIDREIGRMPEKLRETFQGIIRALPTADEQLNMIETITQVQIAITGSEDVEGAIKGGGPSSGTAGPKYTYKKPAWMGDKNTEDMFR